MGTATIFPDVAKRHNVSIDKNHAEKNLFALPKFKPLAEEDTQLQIMAYFQRLASNMTACYQHQVSIVPSAYYLAEFLGVELRHVVAALHTLEELGYHCEYDTYDSPILLSDYLAAA